MIDFDFFKVSVDLLDVLAGLEQVVLALFVDLLQLQDGSLQLLPLAPQLIDFVLEIAQFQLLASRQFLQSLSLTHLLLQFFLDL